MDRMNHCSSFFIILSMNFHIVRTIRSFPSFFFSLSFFFFFSLLFFSLRRPFLYFTIAQERCSTNEGRKHHREPWTFLSYLISTTIPWREGKFMKLVRNRQLTDEKYLYVFFATHFLFFSSLSLFFPSRLGQDKLSLEEYISEISLKG